MVTSAAVIGLWRGGEIDLEKMIMDRAPAAEVDEAVRQRQPCGRC
ncbi:hypothetical protein [Saccharopolyspora montiporae]|nr:hypothetical protein [Saccharopolyspora sp. HNM0983]